MFKEGKQTSFCLFCKQIKVPFLNCVICLSAVNYFIWLQLDQHMLHMVDDY